jgi:Holliday junction resolvasome RuvABC endonuclease subunit
MKRILALDVSYTNIGWSIIEPYTNRDIVTHIGNIKNNSDAKKKKVLLSSSYETERISKVYNQLKDIYLEYKPNGLIAEIPASGGRSQISAVGMARGSTIVTCLVAEYSIPALWTTPDEGKLAMCGDKTASKFKMQDTAIKKYPELKELAPVSKRSKSGYEGWFEHSADSVAGFLAARNGSLVRYLADDNGEYSTDHVLF